MDAAFKQAAKKRDKKNTYLERVSNAQSVQSARSRTLRERVESSGYLPVGRKASSYFDSKADRASSIPDQEYMHRSKKLKVSLETGRVPARRPSQGLEHPSSGKFAAPRSTGSRGNLATSLGSLSPLSCGDGGGFSPPATFPTLADRARVAAPSMGEEADSARLRAEILRLQQESVVHRQDAQVEHRSLRESFREECRSLRERHESLRERNDATEGHCRKLLRRVESLEGKVAELSKKKKKRSFLASPSPEDSA